MESYNKNPICYEHFKKNQIMEKGCLKSRENEEREEGEEYRVIVLYDFIV